MLSGSFTYHIIFFSAQPKLRDLLPKRTAFTSHLQESQFTNSPKACHQQPEQKLVIAMTGGKRKRTASKQNQSSQLQRSKSRHSSKSRISKRLKKSAEKSSAKSRNRKDKTPTKQKTPESLQEPNQNSTEQMNNQQDHVPLANLQVENSNAKDQAPTKSFPQQQLNSVQHQPNHSPLSNLQIPPNYPLNPASMQICQPSELVLQKQYLRNLYRQQSYAWWQQEVQGNWQQQLCYQQQLQYHQEEQLNYQYCQQKEQDVFKDSFKCDACLRKFTSKLELIDHLKIHIEGKFECEVCYKLLATKRSLIGHMKTHISKKDMFTVKNISILEK